MSDHDAVEQLRRIAGREFDVEFHGDRCVSLSLSDAALDGAGLLRQHDMASKSRALDLIATLEALEHLDFAASAVVCKAVFSQEVESLEESILGDPGRSGVAEIIAMVGDVRQPVFKDGMEWKDRAHADEAMG